MSAAEHDRSIANMERARIGVHPDDLRTIPRPVKVESDPMEWLASLPHREAVDILTDALVDALNPGPGSGRPSATAIDDVREIIGTRIGEAVLEYVVRVRELA